MRKAKPNFNKTKQRLESAAERKRLADKQWRELDANIGNTHSVPVSKPIGEDLIREKGHNPESYLEDKPCLCGEQATTIKETSVFDDGIVLLCDRCNQRVSFDPILGPNSKVESDAIIRTIVKGWSK